MHRKILASILRNMQSSTTLEDSPFARSPSPMEIDQDDDLVSGVAKQHDEEKHHGSETETETKSSEEKESDYHNLMEDENKTPTDVLGESHKKLAATSSFLVVSPSSHPPKPNAFTSLTTWGAPEAKEDPCSRPIKYQKDDEVIYLPSKDTKMRGVTSNLPDEIKMGRATKPQQIQAVSSIRGLKDGETINASDDGIEVQIDTDKDEAMDSAGQPGQPVSITGEIPGVPSTEANNSMDRDLGSCKKSESTMSDRCNPVSGAVNVCYEPVKREFRDLSGRIHAAKAKVDKLSSAWSGAQESNMGIANDYDGFSETGKMWYDPLDSPERPPSSNCDKTTKEAQANTSAIGDGWKPSLAPNPEFIGTTQAKKHSTSSSNGDRKTDSKVPNELRRSSTEEETRLSGEQQGARKRFKPSPNYSMDTRMTGTIPFAADLAEEAKNSCGLHGCEASGLRQRSTSPVRHTTAQEINEVCVILDTSNGTMNKFIAPLRTNLGVFWDLVSVASDRTLRMSILTPDVTVDFSSDRSKFLSASLKAVRETPNEAPTNDSCAIDVLQLVLSRVSDLSWKRGSNRYVYIFPSLATKKHEDDTLNDDATKRNFARFVNVLARCLPTSTNIPVGCWLNDNGLLREAVRRSRPCPSFGFLDVKAMASCVVHDENLLELLFSGMTVVKAKTRVTLSERPLGRFRHTSTAAFSSEVEMTRLKPLTTIQEIVSNSSSGIQEKAYRMERQAPQHQEGGNVFYFGKLTSGESPWNNGVHLKSLTLDAVEGKTCEKSHDYYKTQAFVSSAAQLLARIYNKKHKPERCARIRFLHSCIIKESGGRGYYAEEDVGYKRQDFIEFCSAAGKWNENAADESLLRFVQTCFKLSGGDFMVTGLKGVRRGDVYYLTAPSLLSRTCANPHISQLNKEYMKLCRKETKELLGRFDCGKDSPAKPGAGLIGEPEARAGWFFRGLF